MSHRNCILLSLLLVSFFCVFAVGFLILSDDATKSERTTDSKPETGSASSATVAILPSSPSDRIFSFKYSSEKIGWMARLQNVNGTILQETKLPSEADGNPSAIEMPSIQYNPATQKVLYAACNISEYDGSVLDPQKGYTGAILETDFSGSPAKDRRTFPQLPSHVVHLST